ncbi:SDR family oxidoreductase [Ruegeria sp. HKCCD4884]|uniref:SDR family NAD(P)-dependent oxidoreductase n=1 Tax=Ruegeria sp. HKCCD4884 TaxID=2683022 RepID=UPI0014928E24|nr:SDR family oxidoreductase [Ruegeria sp. HKCCD4884]NOD93850.1 SDR family oxidoreductase [Ruegeria sp. HKCCD4884]
MIVVFGGRSRVTEELSVLEDISVFGREDTFESASFISKVSLENISGIDKACEKLVSFLREVGDYEAHLVLLQGVSTRNWTEAFHVNLLSVGRLAERFCQHCVQNGLNGGSITLFGSASATLGGKAAYCSTKAGLVGLMNSLNAEFGTTVRTNLLLPGAFHSTMTDDWGQAKVSRVSENTYSRRLAEPAEIAKAILFLISNKYMCGSTLNISCGQIR